MDRFGLPAVELFATRDNCQRQRFFTRFPIPEAEVMDALRSPWLPWLFYTFPLLPLILKLLEEEAELLLLAPH